MPASGNTKSDRNGIAIITSPSTNPQSASQLTGHDQQSENPQSAIRNPQAPHFSILQYAQGAEQNVRVKPLPRAFHPQPLNYDQRVLLQRRNGR
jgi:hypothetical protein